MKVYQATYSYTETFCSPYEREWEERTEVLVTTLDESLAQEIAAAHNVGKQGWERKFAKIKSYDLMER